MEAIFNLVGDGHLVAWICVTYILIFCNFLFYRGTRCSFRQVESLY